MGQVGGIIEIMVNGTRYNAKGAFECNEGAPKREPVVGHDSYHGHKSLPQAASIKGVTTIADAKDIPDIARIQGATVVAKLATGDTFMLSDAAYMGDGTYNSEEGEYPLEFVGAVGKYI